MRDHKPVSIADQIFDQLEHDILVGKYQRGEIISELKLSQTLGVSRTPIREAITRLLQERILAETAKGLMVVGITHEDMMDMYEIRSAIEGKAAARTALAATEEDLAEFEEILAMQRYHIERQQSTGVDNSDKIKDLDSRFHEMLYICCGSRAYSDTLLTMHRKMMKFRKASVSKNSRAQESLREHEAIFAAVKARDAELAEQLTREHVEHAKNRLIAMGDF